jgi:hypothetical protein
MTKWDGIKMKQLHDRFSENAIEEFQKREKLGDKATHDHYENILRDNITKEFNRAEELKDVKKFYAKLGLGFAATLLGVKVVNPAAAEKLLKLFFTKKIVWL